MELGNFIIPLGVATYSCLVISVITGLLIFKFHVKWVSIKMHILFGILTLILGTFHAGIVIFF